jgi:hypothetical protein
MTDGRTEQRGILEAVGDVGRAAYETYRFGGRTVLKAPLLLLIAVLPEFLQHAAEIHLGMFDSIDRFRALSADPLRWSFGYLKIAGFVIAILAVARFWAVGSIRRTLIIPPAALIRVMVGLLIGFGVAWPFTWLSTRGLAPAINVPLQILSAVIQGGFLVYIVGALLEEASVTPRRAMTSLLPAAVVLTLLAALAFAPSQALHIANHKLALGQPTLVVWILMISDALWVGLFAALLGAALFVGVRTGLTWQGWTISPGGLGRSCAR